MQYIPAKNIISTVKPTTDYIQRDYNMNIYRGCCHGCIYCDSRSECYQLSDFEIVKAKENALVIIEKELKSKRKKGLIATGAMSDPYNPAEEKLQITREALKLVDKYGFGISITTKSPLIARDADILRNIAKHSPADVRLTITAFDDNLAKIIEPHAAPSSERFNALELLAKSNVFCGIFITPVLPFITDSIENITKIIDKAHNIGIKNIVCMPGMTLRKGNREYYYAALDKHFPNLKEKYMALYGEQYICSSQNYKEILETVKNLCEKYNILYTFSSINLYLKSLYANPQTSLF